MSSFVKMLLYVKTYGSVGECFPLLGLECNMIETFKTETNFLRLVKTFLSWLFIYIFSFGVEWSFEWNWSGPKSHSHHSVKKTEIQLDSTWNSTRSQACIIADISCTIIGNCEFTGVFIDYLHFVENIHRDTSTKSYWPGCQWSHKWP